MTTIIKIRRDTSTNWANVNPILASGEPGLETDTLALKYGDGVTEWNDLEYSAVGNAAYADVANIAYNVDVANVANIGNIATINLDGNASNALRGDGSFGPVDSAGTSINNGLTSVSIPTANGNIILNANNGNANIQLTFDTTGNLTIPNDIIGLATIDIDNRATGNSADINLYSADDILLQARDRAAGSTSEGGDITISAGDSAEDGDSSGGDVIIEAGNGGAANVDLGGSGGFIRIETGRGGNASTAVDGEGAYGGGELTLRAGNAGSNMGNIDRGADGGGVVIEAGDSTGNLSVGGSINLRTGAGGANAAAGAVIIDIPASDQGAGGEWIFDATGNIILPSNTSSINYANGSPYGGGGGGGGAELVNGDNSFVLDGDGNVVFEGNVAGQGIDRGLVWDYGANANGVNSEVRQDINGLTVRAWTEDGGGANGFSAPVRIVTNEDANEKQWVFDGDGNLTLPGNLKVPAGNITGNIVSDIVSPTFNSAITGITTGNATVIVTLVDGPFDGPFQGQVTISGVTGTTEANDTWYYEAVEQSEFQLYTNDTFTTPVDGTSWTTYISGGNAVSTGTYLDLTIQGGNVSINSNTETWQFGANGNLTVPGTIKSTQPLVYRGWYATLNQIYDAGDPTFSQIVLSQSSSITGVNQSTDTNNDDFTVTGLTGSNRTAVINLYSQDDNVPIALKDVRNFVETYIDLVLYDNDTLRNSVGDIQAAFATNETALIDSVPPATLNTSFNFNAIQSVFSLTGFANTGTGTGAAYYFEYNNDPGGTVNYSSFNSTLLVPGSGYVVLDEITVPGTQFGGTSPDNDMIITVQEVDENGGIIGWGASGSMSQATYEQCFARYFINDGDGDAYDSGNYVGTNLSSCTFTATSNADNELVVTAVASGALYPFMTFYEPDDGDWVMILWQKSGATEGGPGTYICRSLEESNLPSATYTANGIQYAINDVITASPEWNGGDYGSMVSTTAGIWSMVAVDSDIDSFGYWGETGADGGGEKTAYSKFALGTADPLTLETGYNIWTFDPTGSLTLPGGNSIIESIPNSSLDPLNLNVSTMVFTPDPNYSSQSLVLDPTGPGHIHLRSPSSSSNIDFPLSNIFLGGETSSFEVGYSPNGNSAPNVFIHSNNNTWTFGIDGTLTLPSAATISAPDDTVVRIQAKDSDSVVRAYFRLAPDDGLAEMRALGSRQTEDFNTSDWSTAEWTGTGGGGNIAFTDAADLISFLNNQYNGQNRTFSINGGEYIAYDGFGGDSNNIILYTLASPPADPTTVTSIEFRYNRVSRIDIDYDDDEINILGSGLDIDIDTDESIDIRADGSVEIESDTIVSLLNNSATEPIVIRTSNGNTNQTWEFGSDGNLTLPSGGNLIVSGSIVSSGASPAPTLSGFSSVSALQFTNGNSNVTINANSNTWTFDSTGNLIIPGSSGGFIKTVANSSIGIAAVDNGTNNPAQLMSFNVTANAPTTIVSAYATNALIQTNATGAINTWSFDSAGNLTLPGNTFAVKYANGTQVSLGGSSISNGNSNVSIATSNGNVVINAVGNATITVTGTGANITGTLTSTGKIGYASGATVTQATNRSQGVTINSLAGTIITTSAVMVPDQVDAIAVNNNQVDPATDIVHAQVVSYHNGCYLVTPLPTSLVGNGFYLYLKNIDTFSTANEAVTIRFMVIKAPNA
jgi:hypothetical protein